MDKQLKVLIQEVLENIDLNMGKPKLLHTDEKLKKAVQIQAELIVDEVASIWSAADSSISLSEIKRASDALKESLPLEEIFKLINEIEVRLKSGEFK